MSYFYGILAIIGWVWLGIVAIVLAILLWRSHKRRGAQLEPLSFEEET